MKTVTQSEKFTPEERETHIWFDAEQDLWILESNIPRHFNKALRSGWTPVEQRQYKDGLVCAMTLTAHERAITIKTPIKREVTENQRNAFLNSKL